MKKTTLNIIIAAILAGAVLAGCSSRIEETADSGIVNTVAVTAIEETSASGEEITDEASEDNDSTVSQPVFSKQIFSCNSSRQSAL